jgi:hypothetical protein
MIEGKNIHFFVYPPNNPGLHNLEREKPAEVNAFARIMLLTPDPKTTLLKMFLKSKCRNRGARKNHPKYIQFEKKSGEARSRKGQVRPIPVDIQGKPAGNGK